jgi:hypothetical protein
VQTIVFIDGINSDGALVEGAGRDTAVALARRIPN